MKKKIVSILILCLLLFSQSCKSNNTSNTKNTATNTTSSNTTDKTSSNTTPAEPEYKKITPQEAYDIMQSGEDYILLDVRTDEEYREIRIDGSILIPDTEISTRAESELKDKNAVILVYCRGGVRSEKASRELVDLGYTNVYDIGGILDWPYETVSG